MLALPPSAAGQRVAGKFRTELVARCAGEICGALIAKASEAPKISAARARTCMDRLRSIRT